MSVFAIPRIGIGANIRLARANQPERKLGPPLS